MNAERRALVKKTIPFLIIGLVIFVLYLYFFVGIDEIVVRLQSVDPFYYSLAFVTAFLGMIVYSFAWQSLLNLLSIKIAFRKTFLFMWIGTFVDIIIPLEAVSGEISRAYLIYKSTNENTGKVVASLVSHRILSMGVTVAGLLIGSVFLILQYKFIDPFVLTFVAIVAICAIFTISLLTYLSSRKKTTQKLLYWIFRFLEFISRGHWKMARWKLAVQEMLRAYHEGIDTLKEHPKGVVVPIVLSILAWFSDLLIVLFVFFALHSEIPIVSLIVVYSISVAIPMIPISISGVGPTEIVMTALYTLFLFPSDPTKAGAIAASVTLLTRIVTVWFKLLVGYLAVHLVGVDILSRRFTESIMPRVSEEKGDSESVG
jgi:uncharacterized protein (TIRG00374 family)